jgi:hypothetical protein
MITEIGEIKSDISKNKIGVDSNTLRIDNLDQSVKKLNTNTFSSSRKTYVKAAKPAKPEKRSDPSKIEDAYVATIDSWGGKSFVVLKNEKNNWIPLAKGDYYKSWRFENIQDNKAVFSNGSEVKELMVKE